MREDVTHLSIIPSTHQKKLTNLNFSTICLVRSLMGESTKITTFADECSLMREKENPFHI